MNCIAQKDIPQEKISLIRKLEDKMSLENVRLDTLVVAGLFNTREDV